MTDHATNLAIKQLASDVSRKLNLHKYSAILGDENGTIYDPTNPGSGYVLVREKTSNGLSYPQKVRGPYAGAPVTMRPGVPVELEYDKDGILYVARVSFQDSLAVGSNPLAANSSDGMANSFVSQTDIVTLLSHPTAPPTTSVALRGWKPVINGTFYDFPGALVDLSSYIPSAGNHRVAVIFLKSDFTTIEVKASTTKSTADPIMPADIQEAITARSSGSVPLWGWRLHDGQSSIVSADRFLDLRQAWNTNDFGGFTVRVVTAAGAVTITSADFTVVVNKSSGAATTVNLPASPTTGTIFVIKDGKGDAAANNITLTPASGTIDGSSTFVMNTNYQSCGIQYTGSEWSIIFGNGAGGGTTLPVNVTVRVVTAAGAVTVTTSDYLVIVNKTVGAATTVNLPAGPTTGDTYVIKDGKGDAATNHLTLTPAAGNIDGAGTYVMSTNYESITIVYNGTQWNIV